MTHSRRSILAGAAALAGGGTAALVSGQRAHPASGAGPALAARLTASTASPPLTPSGDTTGHTDTAAIQSLLTGSTPAQLGAGVFYLSQPLTLSQGNYLVGSGGASQGGAPGSTGAGGRLGSVLTFGTGWSTSSVPAGVQPGVIIMTGTDEPARMNVSSLWVDGSVGAISAPAGVDGIAATGAMDSVSLIDVGVNQVNGNGVSAFPISLGVWPDGWYVVNCLVEACAANGIYGSFADSTFMAVHVQTCGQHGLYLQASNNRLLGCRSDANAGDGFHIAAFCAPYSFDTVVLDGCGTNGNGNFGLNTTNPNPTGQNGPDAAGGLASAVTAIGCTFCGDGTNGGQGGGGYAGIAASGEVILTVTGSHVLVSDTTVAAGCPEYGLVVTTAGTGNGKPNVVTLSNCFLNAAGSTCYYCPTPADQPGFANVFGMSGGQWNGNQPSVLAAPSANTQPT
jgi:hypothetical protein